MTTLFTVQGGYWLGTTAAVPRGVRHHGDMSGQPWGFASARRYAVAETLDELNGVTRGTVCLPKRLDWGPPRPFDLTDDADVAVMYETVLRESQDPEDLRMYLDASTLHRLWTVLVLPAALRTLWENRFPELRAAAAA
ncbi:hypothetical protein [Streptomyces sp. BPTC-684]|uniref:hypothetical protein n=1 Tax=Streptomyces sp. BPTC-684 TaxID=3043734 RepID=UPI0024B21A14|nr:hypothetical protein [Streptomyces sp. BPTC-684]WHM37904.1 hypothetical protein QIY60_13960 [Streptomyces sp. BPTC-684]